jgi:hypothetical protein
MLAVKEFLESRTAASEPFRKLPPWRWAGLSSAKSSGVESRSIRSPVTRLNFAVFAIRFLF